MALPEEVDRAVATVSQRPLGDSHNGKKVLDERVFLWESGRRIARPVLWPGGDLSGRSEGSPGPAVGPASPWRAEPDE